MKKLSSNHSISYLASALIGILLLMTRFEAGAQTFVNTEATVTIPADENFIRVALRGGDGGHGQDFWGNTRSGGIGAWVEGYLEIGTGNNQLRPGGVLKMIAGGAGRNNGNVGGGGGGGGSALVYRASGGSDWVVLAVAGGGGGSGEAKGEPGSAVLGEAIPGVSDSSDDNRYYGGGSAFEDSNTDRSMRGRAGMVNGEPTRAPGGYSIDGSTGGAGFGSGAGSINPLDRMGRVSGGGGGGYYGGDGVDIKGGKGGGSFYHSDYFSYVYVISFGTTFSSQDGFVRYQFLDEIPLNAIHFAFNSNKCIDDYGSSTSNGNNILSYSCTGNPNQNWWINTDDLSIHSALDFAKCLDLNQSNTANGTNIQLWDCNGTDAQKWVYNGLYQTIHSGVNSDKCMDATNGSAYPNSNVNVQLWDCNYTNNNMKWTIDGAATVSSPVKARFIVPVLAPGFAVHSHTGNESGSNIQLWTKDQTLYAEYWYFDGLAIKMREFRDLCIDLKSSNTSNGNNIQLYNCNGTNAQKWIYDGMTQTIRSVVNPDKCMQIEYNTDGVYGKRSNVQIHDCNGSAAQLFLIQE